MASGDNVDVIEVVETTSFPVPAQPTVDHLRPEQSTVEEDYKSIGEKITSFDSSVVQHGTTGGKTLVGVSRNKSERERKIGHRRVGVGGEITYKKIQTTQIMGSIQLGIQHAVGGLASKPERDLLMQDFMTVETTNFPSEGSNHTPAHHFSEFKFKNYAPIAFRYFRDLFGIQPDDFLMSMCSAPLRELSNPGASGSIFYLTDDDEFIIKTVQHKEGEFLQTLLPGYYMNLNQNPRTLLPKFFGLYCYRCNSKNVRLIAMNNLLPSSVKLHQKYDLKGSTYKRKASKTERSKSSPTYKDLDFIEHHPEGIFLEADTYGALVKTIQRDCRVLESFKIMDYSLLVGIHNLDQAVKEKAQEQRLSASADEEIDEMGGESDGFIQSEREKQKEDRIGAAALNRSRSINRQRLVAHSTAMESIQAESEPIDEEDDVPSGGIPARNARGERLLLFLGIIDILQSYRLKKKLEHTWKSMIHDGDTVSVHRPGFYAQRFQDFMAKTVFKKIPSLDLPEIKGNHRKFRNLVTSYIALKHSPSKRKSISRPLRPLEGDFDSTAVAATGGSTMHATSPTKAVSPPDPAISATNVAASVPIAPSPPVNLAAGPLSPPPLTLATGQGPHHEHPPGAAPTVKVTSYPAVLKGRSAASPPNPNLVPSGKIPPPVPPRGTGASRTARSSEDHRAASTAASTTSSVTSSRGDEAAIITRYRLHDSSCDLHRSLLSDHSCTSTSITTAKTVASTITAATSIKTTSATSNALHAHTSTSNTCRVTDRDRIGGEAGRIRLMDSIQHWHTQELDEDEEEFVSVVKIEDAYFIKTSLHPLRPDRGIRRSSHLKDFNETGNDNYEVSKKGTEKRGDTKTDHLAKFTYFLNPSSRADLMNYKMSRKDKKYSETYYERVKRKQKNLEASITTVSHLRKPVEDARTHHIHTSYMEAAEEWTNYNQKILKFASIKKDSILLQKIREKSKRRKRIAPEPSMKKRTSKRETFNGNLAEIEKTDAKRENEKLSLKMSSLGNKSGYQIQEKSNKNDTGFTSKRKESAIRCDETKQNCPSGRDNNYLDKKKNISKNINDEQINNTGGFKGIFANSYKAENMEDRIVHEGISKFDRQANERFKKYKNESPKSDCKSCDGNSYFREEESSFDIKKTNSKDVKQDKLLNTIKREEFIFSSFENDIRSRNSDVLKCSVFEKVKNFEKIKMDVRGKTKDARREVHLDNLNYGNEIDAIKRKFALPVNEIRLNQEEEKIVLKGRLINTDVKHKRQTFKSLSSSHCDNLSFNSEFGMLKPNVSFLHTYRKTRSFTCGTLPSTCSTPPPPFDDAVRSNDQTLASGGHLQQGSATPILTSNLFSTHSKQNKVVHHVTLTKTYHDTVSISDVHLESSGSGSGSGGRETKSSLSVESGGSSSRGGGGLTWTPPAGSAEGSTPTWTEGTPSFTESSSSGDIGKLLYALNIYYGS
ncbi:PREDICTED: uncharacterized protein LOC105147238 [Acromyrmex echinatior]|uniref:uncharacterized protein LOC105147238 n=1 Tax=Acromyrmex echinatior TaxID=103372 RepID=UPI000580F6F3|nr:PREDICTED: uncharacterized protein LOC105147238 [Acromyrmex echinatior]